MSISLFLFFQTWDNLGIEYDRYIDAVLLTFGYKTRKNV